MSVAYGYLYFFGVFVYKLFSFGECFSGYDKGLFSVIFDILFSYGESVASTDIILIVLLAISNSEPLCAGFMSLSDTA